MIKDKSIYFTGLAISYGYAKQDIYISVYIKAFVSAKFAHKSCITQQVSGLVLVHGKEFYFIGFNVRLSGGLIVSAEVKPDAINVSI